MQIVQLCRQPLSKLGGVEKVAQKIHGLISENNCKITTFSLTAFNQKKYNYNAYANNSDINIFSIELFKFKFPVIPHQIYKLFVVLRTADIFLIHHPDPFSAALGIISSKFFNLKLYIFWHADISQNGFLAFLLKPLLAFSLDCSHIIITTSPKLSHESSFISRYKSKTSICPLFPVGYKPEFYINTPFEDRTFDCAYFGRLEPYKNVHLAIKAFEKSKAQSLLIAGSGSLLGPLKSQAKLVEQIANKKVVFCSSYDDSQKYKMLSISKCLLLPSSLSSEAFGIVQVEAFSMGTPVISNEIHSSGVSWVNQHDVTGFVSTKTHDLHHEYIDFLLDSVKWNQLSLNSRLRYEITFTEEIFTRVILEVLTHNS